MIWLVVIMAAQSGALAYLIWTVRDLRKERTPILQYTPLESTELAEKLEYTALAEKQAHEAMKQQRIDQALAEFGPPAPKPWPGPQASAQPKLTPRTTPRPDRSAEETGAWPYAGDHAWHADETETLPAVAPKRPE